MGISTAGACSLCECEGERESKGGRERQAVRGEERGSERSASMRTGFSFPCSVNLAVSWC